MIASKYVKFGLLTLLLLIALFAWLGTSIQPSSNPILAISGAGTASKIEGAGRRPAQPVSSDISAPDTSGVPPPVRVESPVKTFHELLALAESGDFAAANTLFARTKGCRRLPLNPAELAAREARIASLDNPSEAAAERHVLRLQIAQHPHCAVLSRFEADQEVRITLLAARGGNNEARVHYWLNGEPPPTTDLWQRGRAQAEFEREANALLDAAVAAGDGMALVRRAESYDTGRYVVADPVRAYAFGYASLLRKGPPTDEAVALLRSSWGRNLNPEALSRAQMLGEEIFEICCSGKTPRGE